MAMMEFTTDHQSGPENTDYQRSSHACPEYSDFFSVIALALLLLEIEGPWWLTDFFTLSISYFRFFSLFDTATALEQLKGQPIREGLSWHASATSKATKTRHYHHRWLPAKSGAKRAAKR